MWFQQNKYYAESLNLNAMTAYVPLRMFKSIWNNFSKVIKLKRTLCYSGNRTQDCVYEKKNIYFVFALLAVPYIFKYMRPNNVFKGKRGKKKYLVAGDGIQGIRCMYCL